MKILPFLCVTVLIYAKFINAKNEYIKVAIKQKTVSKNTTSVTQTTIAPQALTTSRPLFPGIKLPCSCLEGQCGCCTGVILDRFNQKACLNITYEPDDFALTAAMSMNGKVLYKRTVSGKNPPPMCIRLPRLQFIRFCVQFSNIYFASRNIHLCIDMEANWEDLTLLEWSFDCIRMGASGVAVVGPEDGGGLPVNPVDTVDQTNEDYDDSARNLPISPKYKSKKISCPRNVIFDESLKYLTNFTKPDKSLIKVKTLKNGNYFISYKL